MTDYKAKMPFKNNIWSSFPDWTNQHQTSPFLSYAAKAHEYYHSVRETKKVMLVRKFFYIYPNIFHPSDSSSHPFQSGDFFWSKDHWQKKKRVGFILPALRYLSTVLLVNQ